MHAVRYLKTFAVFNVREFVVFFLSLCLSVCLAWVRKQVPPVASWLLFCAVCCGKCFSGSFFFARCPLSCCSSAVAAAFGGYSSMLCMLMLPNFRLLEA